MMYAYQLYAVVVAQLSAESIKLTGTGSSGICIFGHVIEEMTSMLQAVQQCKKNKTNIMRLLRMDQFSSQMVNRRILLMVIFIGKVRVRKQRIL